MTKIVERECPMALDPVIDLEREVLRLRDELAKATRQRDAMVSVCQRYLPVNQGSLLDSTDEIATEILAVGEAALEILAASEAAKEEK